MDNISLSVLGVPVGVSDPGMSPVAVKARRFTSYITISSVKGIVNDAVSSGGGSMGSLLSGLLQANLRRETTRKQ
jgi:hypothetical protein